MFARQLQGGRGLLRFVLRKSNHALIFRAVAKLRDMDAEQLRQRISMMDREEMVRTLSAGVAWKRGKAS